VILDSEDGSVRCRVDISRITVELMRQTRIELRKFRNATVGMHKID